MPNKRVLLLYLIDTEFRKTMIPVVTKRMKRAIMRVFDKNFIAETFPELAEQDPLVDKDEETDGTIVEAKTDTMIEAKPLQ